MVFLILYNFNFWNGVKYLASKLLIKCVTLNTFLSFMQKNSIQSKTKSVLFHFYWFSFYSYKHLRQNLVNEVLPWLILSKKQSLFFFESYMVLLRLIKQFSLQQAFLMWYLSIPLIKQSSSTDSEALSKTLKIKNTFFLKFFDFKSIPFLFIACNTLKQKKDMNPNKII